MKDTNYTCILELHNNIVLLAVEVIRYKLLKVASTRT